MLSPATKIASYEVVALLGAGGMGEVYRARDTRLNRDVAMKVEAPRGREASPSEAGSPQPKSRAQRGISGNPIGIVILRSQRRRRISPHA